MVSDLDIPFDRITYRDGQLLTARDMGDDVRRAARLRWLHTRYLHETWGIALGFEVNVASGNRTVVVGPGYAVDNMGRDIVLPGGISVPVPGVTGPETLVLTMSYLEDCAFRARYDLVELCLDGGLGPRHERPGLAWRRQEDVRVGPEVPLCQARVANGVMQGGLDLRPRHMARRLLRPHIGWGETEAGATGWRAWIDQGHSPLGLEVTVTTAEAGFIATPAYFATLQGDFGNQAGQSLADRDYWAAGALPAFSESPFGFIAVADSTSFIYRVMRGTFPFGVAITPVEAELRGWFVAWSGLESVMGCEPSLDLRRLLTLAGYLVP
jgi:hypothetical protein